MEWSWANILWIIFTAVCFGVGFMLAWRGQKKRIQARYVAAVEAELKKRLAEEVVRSITQGPELSAAKELQKKSDGE